MAWRFQLSFIALEKTCEHLNEGDMRGEDDKKDLCSDNLTC